MLTGGLAGQGAAHHSGAHPAYSYAIRCVGRVWRELNKPGGGDQDNILYRCIARSGKPQSSFCVHMFAHTSMIACT